MAERGRSYALRFDRLAATHLRRTVWYLAGNRFAIGSATTGLAYFASGLVQGPKFRLTAPPRYH